MAIRTYRKKPVEIQAIRFLGWNWKECIKFMGDSEISHTAAYIDIETLEGTMRCGKGDYIIRGVNGEFFPCKADIFKKTYEVVE
jgi:hypothetical protein|nr:MAG TPA_asm: PGDYG protein [Caudoviricetes sp.]